MTQIIPILRTRRQRRLARLHRGQARTRSAILGLGTVFSLILAALILLVALSYATLTRDLPSIEILPRLLNPPDGALLQPTRLYDRSGTRLLLVFGLDQSPRAYTPLSEANPQHIAPALAESVVAVADPGFYKHSGYVLSGWQDSSLHPTIAQRLASELLLYAEKPSLLRALRERLLAAQLTARYGRTQLLEWYLNSADFGHYAFGAEAASQLYFGKSAAELSLAESAILAGVSEAPSINPFDDRVAAFDRAHKIIVQLRADGLITEKEASAALVQTVHLQAPPAPQPQFGEAFINLALAQLESRVSRARLERGGLTVITTLDYDLQQQASCVTGVYAARLAGSPEPQLECSAARFLPALPSGAPLENGSASALILDPSAGQVLAVTGETRRGQETALMAAHDPGSLETPFIYLAGFARGMSPASLVWDIPGLVPVQNEDGKYHGPLRLRLALANDYRVPAERVREQMGAASVTKIASSFGLALDSPVHLLEVAGAYGAFGTQGVYYGQEIGEGFAPATILRIESADGALWLDWSAPQARPVLEPGLAYLLTNVLSDDASRWPSLGSPNVTEIGRPAGVKLGQTSSGRDAWAVGYTSHRVVAAWTGVSGETHLSPRLPAALWNALMQVASQDQARDGWVAPEDVTVMDVCDPSGLLPGEDCPSVVSEIFLVGSEPTQTDTLYKSFSVNRETGLLATVFTPPQFVEKRVYMMVPVEAASWAESVGLPSPPSTYDAIQPPAKNPAVNITAPALFADVGGVVQITGTAAGENFQSYRVQVGRGLNPEKWIQVGQDSASPVEDGVLAEWDTQGLSGLYAVQLVVVRADQRVETAVIQVTVHNPD